ncbi:MULTISPECIES: ADP-dependent NAD(P)H-hydrate dehydratase [Microbacterium]|uniref:ADP-dependent (S)-NAD(P)H-hydrate dehydratase n=1 Tax=Microbacterium wangchenii TaxID=2541726 RepID=A0ABX5SPT0_9MICO|nr:MULTISPECIES: ADP/ATP-dependent (S)-NAD(P)H-hydrate dehydratase [Microbacterium]MCK6066843.1 NAD(P)H-hydrate dehydratase [Microbacterium sp. EYE_512]QBR88155.1 NAD(P)H-hydrate dehydratase [Microbacterium wangchenii]TXK18055.1 NAD(P)H-hydrate dehydratase [Microbacterium wangchenii]
MGAADWTADDVRRILRLPTRSDDKYSRGVVGLRTGSQAYPGAAVLGVEAAWRTGVGMVRYLGPEVPTSLVLARRPETVAAAGRVQAWVIGSGTDAAHRTPEDDTALRRVLVAAEPVVVDAGALDLAPVGSAPRIITPHGREHDRLRAQTGLPPAGADADDDAREAAAVETAAHLGVTVLLKGATTIVATPGGWFRRIGVATPWLATAGTGDVLAGIVGAVVAGAADADDLGPLGATGAWLHAEAGAAAAGALGARGGPITAMEVAAAVPRVVAGVLAGG